jgi:hypothetical protein
MLICRLALYSASVKECRHNRDNSTEIGSVGRASGQSIHGNAGTVRLVMLPFESHGYEAMESTEHVLYEMLAWFDKYVKNASPREATFLETPK